ENELSAPRDGECNDAERVLMARSPFEVLQIEPSALDEKQVRTQYRKMALRVHPDKQSEDAETFKKAFARLDAAKEALENLCGADKAAVSELHQVLQAEVHTREGAAQLLGVDGAPLTETEQVAEEAEKSLRLGMKKLEKLEHLREHEQALPRQEALRLQPLATSRALGARDMRFPAPLVLMRPESVRWNVEQSCRVALLCGATSALTDEQLLSSSASFKRSPKASALRWCQETSAPSVVAACLRFEAKGSNEGPKRLKQSQPGSIFLRHILFRHQQLRVMDPAARRDGARSPAEAEATALKVLLQLQAEPQAFVRLCREHSDCASAEQPGALAGHMGWVARGEQEPSLEEAAFALQLNELGDLVATSRGVHLVQRIG
ncbi:unnamed protein product, partial [Effrenium voratum]